MGDMWIRDIEVTTLIAITSVLVVLPIQLLLCFKVKPIFLRLLPSILLTGTTILLFAMMAASRDWDAIGYAVLGVFSGVLLIFSGIGWGIWGLVALIGKKKQGVVQNNTSITDK